MAMFRTAIRREIARLSKNVTAEEIIGPRHGSMTGIFEIPNFRRMPFWSYIWTQNFVNRQHLFNVHHSGYIAVCLFFWYCGCLDTAPLERREKYYMNSAKFRMQTAYANPGTRPAAKIAQEQAKLRYYYRGNDHPFTLNETKDFYFKMRENYLIQEYPGVQYPFVYRHMMPEEVDDPLKVDLYPLPQAQPHFHEHGDHH
ncbi:unnamed protein product [Amoebophrya sp. A25]|nr:unnamed protein product [Amoebophrya sp. A25]|eukprot:GSA25T00014970001.1